MNNKWIGISLNFLFWLLTGWLLTSSFSIVLQDIELINGVKTIHVQRSDTIIIQMLLLILLLIPVFYLNLWNITRLRKNKSTKRVIILSIALVIAFIALYKLLEVSPVNNLHPPLPTNISIGVIIFYFAISTTYGIGKLLQHAESKRHKADLERKQAELSLLRSQLHPHFLFNTLNNLMSMVDQEKSPALAKALDRLSGLLRYVVYDTAVGKVAVNKEIDFIKNYAELQALRFEKNEIQFNLEIKGDFDRQKIEPGIFIPFIENAFKYGVEPEKESQIRVVFDLSKKDEISFLVSNPVDKESQNINGKGSGIQSTQERLKLVYPGKHQLKITKDGAFTVELWIKSSESNNS